MRLQTGGSEEDKSEKETPDSEKESKEEKEKEPSKKESDSSDDDSSEEEDEEDSGDSDEDDEKLSEEDITKLALTDPSKLPPKLREYAKKLQSIFTKRMQEASSYKKKAQLFDRLAADPKFLAWMQEQEEGGSSKSKSRSRESDEEDDDDEDEDAPLTRKSLKKLLDEKIGRIEKKLSARDQAELERQERIKVKKFKQAYPDYKLYEDKILELIDENPRLSYVRAYKLAKEESEEAEDSAKGKAEKFRRKKDANSQKPNRMGASESDSSAGGKKHKDGVRGAFERAKAMLARGKR